MEPLKHYPEFENFRLTGQFTDLILLVGSNPCFQLNGHKLVLQQINFFKNQVNQNVEDNGKTTITINDLDSIAVDAVIKFIYTGQLDLNLDSFKNILMVSKRFGLDDYINCWKMKEMIEFSEDMELRTALNFYIRSNMISLARDNSFLSEPQLQAVMHGMRRNQFLRFTVSRLILENEVEESAASNVPLPTRNFNSACEIKPNPVPAPAPGPQPHSTNVQMPPGPHITAISPYVRNQAHPQTSTPIINRVQAQLEASSTVSPIRGDNPPVPNLAATIIKTQESQSSKSSNRDEIAKHNNPSETSNAVTPPLEESGSDRNQHPSEPMIRVKSDIFNQNPGSPSEPSIESPPPVLIKETSQENSPSASNQEAVLVVQTTENIAPAPGGSNVSPKQRRMIETLFPLGLPKPKNTSISCTPNHQPKRLTTNLSPPPVRPPKAVRFSEPSPLPIERPIKRAANGPEIDTRIFESAIMLLFPVVKNKVKYLDAFDPRTGHVIRLHKFIESNDHACIIQWDNHIYAFGGNKSRESSTDLPSTWEFANTRNKVEIFNHNKFEPTNGPQLSFAQGRRCQSASGWNDFIYLIGGERSTTKNMVSVNTVMKLNIKKKTWFTCPNIQCARSAHDSIVVGNHLYVVGGFGAEGEVGEPLKSVRRLDLLTDRWECIENLNVPRYNLRLFSWDNKIYAVGGINTSIESEDEGSLNSVERYDPETKVWEFVAPMSHSRKGFGLISTPDTIYVIGGNSIYPALLTMEAYNPRDNTWTPLPWPEKLDRTAQFPLSTNVSGEYVTQNINAFLNIVSKKKARLSAH